MLPLVTPLRLGVCRAPFDHPEWIFELKYDGFRALLYIENGTARMISRNGNVYRRFDELGAALAETIRVRDAIIDGEIACLDPEGRPQFNELLYRRAQPCFVVFDLLWLNGQDQRQSELLYRKAVLSTLVPHGTDCVLQAQHVLEYGQKLYAAACRRNLEGIVAKWGRAPYAEARGKSPWLKIRNPAYTQEVMPKRREQFERWRKP